MREIGFIHLYIKMVHILYTNLSSNKFFIVFSSYFHRIFIEVYHQVLLLQMLIN